MRPPPDALKYHTGAHENEERTALLSSGRRRYGRNNNIAVTSVNTG